MEQRAGQVDAAATAFEAALRLDPDAYTTLDYVDLLIDARRPGDALRRLRQLPRTDAVVLRLAIAGTQAHSPQALADVAEMRERIALANQRPEARIYHGREQAMFALAVEHDAPAALQLARGDVTQQREPLDLLVFARAAHAEGSAAARAEVRNVVIEVGLVDRRINALL